MDARPSDPTRASRRGALGVAAFFVVLLLPFLDRPFNIDDPVWIWMAQQIAEHPLDCFGFDINWRGTPMPMHETLNPPLHAYLLVLPGLVSGWSETALHVSMLVPAAALAAGIYALAVRFSARPLLASLCAIGMPAVLLSATTLMSDVPLVALWTWSLVLWDRGLGGAERGDLRHKDLALAALFAGLAFLTKYPATGILPLLVAHGIVRRKSVGAWLAWLAVPLAMMAGWELWTAATYGQGHYLGSVGSAAEVAMGTSRSARLLGALSFTGGCTASLLFLAPWLARRWTLLVFAVLAAIVFALLARDAVATQRFLSMPFDFTAAGAAQFTLWVVAGVAVLVLALSDVRETRSADAITLALWVLGVFFTVAVVKWWSDGRGILQMAPPVAVLVARRIERSGQPVTHWLGVALAASLTLSLVVTWSDYRLAHATRRAAREITTQHASPGQTIWFLGHWGFQYYAQLAGARPMDLARMGFGEGDVVVLPGNNTGVGPVPREALDLADSPVFDVPSWVTTMNPGSCAGFHSTIFGPLPFAFGPLRRPEIYLVVTATRDFP